MRKQIIGLLETSLREMTPLRLFINIIEMESIDGVIIGINKDLVLIRPITEFTYDGYMVLPLKLVKNARVDEHEQTELRIMQHNGELQRLCPPCVVETFQAMTIYSLATYLQERDIWPAFEVFEKETTAYYVGKIIGVHDQFVGVYAYDDVGQWEGAYKIKFSDIARITWEHRYLINFNSYMKSITPEEQFINL